MRKKRIERGLAFFQIALDAEERMNEALLEDSEYGKDVRKNLSDFEPIRKELKEVGFEVDRYFTGMANFVRMHPNYKQAIPILIKWLPKLDNISIKRLVIKMLTDKRAQVAAPVLIREFRKALNLNSKYPKELESYQFSVGEALSYVADNNFFEEIVSIVRNKEEFGDSRLLVVSALANMKNPKAIPVLIEQLQDDVICGMAIKALRKLKAYIAKSEVAKLINHKNIDIRNEAKKFMVICEKVKGAGLIK